MPLVISDVIADRVRDLRKREGVSRQELAWRAQGQGAPDSFTATVVGFLETGRPKDGRRTRDFSLDEVVWVAKALEVPPLDLFGETWAEFVGADPQACPNCAGQTGELERRTRESIDALEQLEQLEPALAATALRLARAADRSEDDNLHRLTRELRASLEQIAAGRRGRAEPDDDEDEDDDLADPDGGDIDLSGLEFDDDEEPADETPPH